MTRRECRNRSLKIRHRGYYIRTHPSKVAPAFEIKLKPDPQRIGPSDLFCFTKKQIDYLAD